MSAKIRELCAGKPVAIFGTGASGTATKKLLDSLGIESIFYAEVDSKKTGEIDGKLLQPFDENNAKKHSLVVYSPAFRPDHKWITLAEQNGATTVCEADFASLAWSGKIIAITGTNGKTTLTKFLTKVLNESGFDAVSAGNIGFPLSQYCVEFGNDKNKIAVYELSSFQTSKLKFLKPDILLWTNFAPDHLDWHKDMREYFDAKNNLLNATTGRIFIGSSVKEFADANNIIILDELNTIPAPEPFDNSIQSRNFNMAVEFGKEFNIAKEKFEESAKSFELPNFRFSTPIEIDNVRFYNDSKATNAHATIAALQELKNENHLIWIGGGKDKNCDLTELVEAICETAKGAILIGQTSDKLKVMLDNKLPSGTYVCESMQDAVRKSMELSKKNSAVLFSPAFSSFGMFSNYSERGKSFKNEVLCLKNLKK